MDDGTNRNVLSQIDTSFTFNVYDDSMGDGQTSPMAHSPSTPRLSTSPSQPASPATLPSFGNPNTNTRARSESRKLLSHVLLQLANRHKPPSIVDALTNTIHEASEKGFSALAESFREAVKRGTKPDKRPERRPGAQLDDSDDEQDTNFSTDETIDLMLQLKDVLTMSIAQGWQIFDDG